MFRSLHLANIDTDHLYPADWKIPKFDKFSGEENENMVEHIARFTALMPPVELAKEQDRVEEVVRNITGPDTRPGVRPVRRSLHPVQVNTVDLKGKEPTRGLSPRL